HFWTAAFGTSETALRLLSAIIGIATVWFAYRLADELLGRRAALYVAALLALSTLPIYYSREARAYALFALLGVASMHTLVGRARAAAAALSPTAVRRPHAEGNAAGVCQRQPRAELHVGCACPGRAARGCARVGFRTLAPRLDSAFPGWFESSCPTVAQSAAADLGRRHHRLRGRRLAARTVV